MVNVVHNTNSRVTACDKKTQGYVCNYCSIPVRYVFMMQVTAMKIQVDVKQGTADGTHVVLPPNVY